MEKKTIGTMISLLRKEKGMTQQTLAEKMNVTDKAVSKWERDLSFPDVNTIPKLAEILGVSIDELMHAKVEDKKSINKNKIIEVVDVVLKAIGIAMGIAVTVLSILGELEIKSAFIMLGIGLATISISMLKK
ncbi:helix-turn-helix domain-containing protein [Vagococcus carniphilus]|uniref:Transcriptional regulator n=1 Tax=Vagococcus carniphilus TaxID=218144 RepID=A0A430AVD3_9ENTE|nr:helix-turn-helix transcriptional regulator [Vagococcus carniphilus]QNN73126.1 helix-turn-helix transcriptional regulator [Vagococcus carniphilus]RSU12018.1 transcriptional regulator [Vagococcus carniphilus]